MTTTPKLDIYINDKSDKLSKNSIDNYSRLYKKIHAHFGIDKIEPADIPEEDLIIAINNDMTTHQGEIITNPNTKTALFNTIIGVKKHLDLPNTKLLKAKENLLSSIIKHREKVREQKSVALPTHKDLKNHFNNTFERSEWVGTILLSLMEEFFTRNQDLDIYIVNSIKKAKDKTKNYLVLREADLVYIKNKYKTSKSYGQLKQIFKNKKTRTAVIEFLKTQPPDQFEYPLMVNSKGEKLDDTSQAKFIKKFTFKNLSESDYFKIRVNELEKKSDMNGLLKASKRRGTNLNTVIQNYSLKNIKPI
tara:strand:+ start:426 stop:1340 length:915 start_codon:yes stop_codon:yes gene_type:complete